MTTPVITSQTAPPPTLYQDDPNLSIGQLQQTDFEAWGANVYFTREVRKQNKILKIFFIDQEDSFRDVISFKFSENFIYNNLN